jgi:hypothetical protein
MGRCACIGNESCKPAQVDSRVKQGEADAAQKVIAAEDAVAIIRDGDVVASTGSSR